MRHEGVDEGRGRRLLALARGEGLPQGALDEAVFLVGEGRLDILAQRLGDVPRLAVADRRPFGVAGACLQVLFDLGVALEHLHGVVARREGLGQLVAVGAHVAVQAPEALLDDRTLVDVDVAHALVASFVDGDHRVEQLLDALVVAGLDRDHRHTQHGPQLLVVELGAAGLQLVVHVERHDHARVDVDQLGGQVEVALDVRRHDRVDDHVGGLLGQVLPHVALLGRVGRKGVGARQVGHLEAVAPVGAVAHLGADGHAAVVAHVLVPARYGVEERRLAAVRVAHERHADRVALAGHHLVEGAAPRLVGSRHVVRTGSAGGSLPFERREVGLCLLVGQHLDHLRFAAAQRDVVSHDAVFDRVLERGVENHLDALSAHETHLHDAAPESSVSRHLEDDGGVAGLQFGKFHLLVSSFGAQRYAFRRICTIPIYGYRPFFCRRPYAFGRADPGGGGFRGRLPRPEMHLKLRFTGFFDRKKSIFPCPKEGD